MCEATEKLNVHHTIYRGRLEDTLLEDLETLCRRCHRIQHGLWVESDREFDVLWKKVDRKFMDPSERPDPMDYIKLVALAEDDDDDLEVEALLRDAAKVRIVSTSSRMWESWISKPVDVRLRLWPWAHNKRLQIKQELEVSGVR